MPDKAILHLTLIAEAIGAIRSYIAGLDRTAFLADALRQDAVAMRIQIVGESARRLLAGERAEAPEIDWPQIVALRNRISHDYRSTNFEVVWEIVTSELDALDAAVRRMLAVRGA